MGLPKKPEFVEPYEAITEHNKKTEKYMKKHGGYYYEDFQK